MQELLGVRTVEDIIKLLDDGVHVAAHITSAFGTQIMREHLAQAIEIVMNDGGVEELGIDLAHLGRMDAPKSNECCLLSS